MLLTIVGGTYRETCLSPPWDQLYGSGLRAATVVAYSGECKVSLVTAIDRSNVNELKLRTKSPRIQLRQYRRAHPIGYHYAHPLGTPTVSPGLDIITPRLCAPITVDAALLFGMVESRMTIRSRCLVYDPQSPHAALPPSLLRAKADRLCIVANVSELRSMTTALSGPVESTIKAAKFLLQREGAEAVVVKDGVRGARVVTEAAVRSIPCYRTPEVFKIGSGDVFSAVFALNWMIRSQDVVTAAFVASRETARYCASQSLSILKDPVIEKYPACRTRSTGKRQIYLAGPLFNVPERWFVDETVRVLERFGLKVFSPMHDVGTSPDTSAIARSDLAGLDASRVVFAVVDGVDCGTIFEIGYAIAKGKPVITYGERVADSDMTMLYGTRVQHYRDYAAAIYHAAWLSLA